MNDMRPKPWLEGIRVLDLSRLLPGPFCTLLMADMGADVLKIEDPRGGDYARYYPPLVDGVGVFFAALNRNKRSLSLNLKAPEAVDILKSLVGQADVIVESFRPGVMDRLGVGYQVLKAINPGLVFCSISGYGATGSMARRAGHDLNFMARAGLLDQNGRSGEAPVVPGFQVADIAGGALYAALGITSALFHRERTGEGSFVDISMTEGALSLHLPFQAQRAAASASSAGEFERGQGMLSGGVPSYNVYETADGRHLAVGPLEPKFWVEFLDAIGLPALAGDGLSTGPAGAAVVQTLSTRLRERSLAQWVEIFSTREVCVEPIRSPAEVLQDELFRAREVFFKLAGVQHVCTPLTPREAEHRAPPGLGEHTAEVLESLGLGDDEVSALRGGGIV